MTTRIAMLAQGSPFLKQYACGSAATYHPSDKLKLQLCNLRESISSADVRFFLQRLDMGIVEEPVVGKPERFDRSWAIVHFQTSADKKAFIENNLEWLPMATSLWRKKFGPHNGSATMASARCRSVNAFSFRRITKRNNGDNKVFIEMLCRR